MDKVLGIIYLSMVAILVTFYLVYTIHSWIGRIVYKKALKRIREADNPPPAETVDIVGKTTTVFHAPLIVEIEKPFMRQDLEPERSEFEIEVETETNISPGDIEIKQSHNVFPDDDELDDFSDGNTTIDELSKGLTFEQISHALEVVEGRKSGGTDEYIAGETFSVMPTDFLNMICMQAEHEAVVKKLIAGYLDFPDKIKPVPKTVANFDINEYV
jgi:hypothetical protein